MDAPEVVDENVEDTEHDDKESCRPLRLEADRDHDTSRKTDDRDKYTSNAPLPTESESDEQEDEENATGEQEAVGGGMRSRA